MVLNLLREKTRRTLVVSIAWGSLTTWDISSVYCWPPKVPTARVPVNYLPV
jgi:hypothetical protein